MSMQMSYVEQEETTCTERPPRIHRAQVLTLLQGALSAAVPLASCALLQKQIRSLHEQLVCNLGEGLDPCQPTIQLQALPPEAPA